MIKYKVGVGGHYAKWSEAWNLLCAVDPLADDYEFEQISDITENAWPNTGVAANRLDLNGHSVKFHCAWENSHQGSPTRGYVTNLSGASGKINPVCLAPSTTDGFTVENLYLKQITVPVAAIELLGINSFDLSQKLTIHVTNVLIEGNSTTYTNGINFGGYGNVFYFKNSKIWGCAIGFDGLFHAAGGLELNRDHVVENVVAYNNITNLSGAYNLPTNKLTFINCAAVGGNGSTVKDWGQLAATSTLINCADSDNTINVPSNAAVKTNCISNVNEANEFESLSDTNADYLNLAKGYANASPGASPQKGLHPLLVKYRSNLEYVFPSGLVLYYSGTAPSYGSDDIAGKEYGKYGYYPIGCHNAEII